MSFYAISVGAISMLEAVMFRHAFRAGLNRTPMPVPVANFGTVASLIPVGAFAVSIPIAFINPIAGMVVWALAIPAQVVHDRFKPEGADEFFD